jgi:hypothetical protein
MDHPRRWAKTILSFTILFLALTRLACGAADVSKDEPVLLPAVVVTAPPGSIIYTISFESKLPLPFSKVIRASFKKIFPGPAKDAGIKDGDEILRIDGVEVRTMTVLDLRGKVKRERINGTREEFLVRTPKGEMRTVTVEYREKNDPQQGAGNSVREP